MRIRLRRPNRTLATPLETERFELQPLGLWDTWRVTQSWRNDPELLQGILLGPTTSPHKWLKKGPFPDNVDRFSFAIVPKGSSDAIGLHMIRLFGYRSARNMVGLHDRSWWGKGVVVEVRAKLMNHFFRHGGVDRFCGTTDSRNMASIFNYRRLGYDHVGTQHRERLNPVTGEVTDLLMFEMFRDTWMKGPFAERADGSAER